MTNAREEMLRLLKGKEIKCAVITKGYRYYDVITKSYQYYDEENHLKFELKVNHTEEEFQSFLNLLDFNYDAGYGGQELYGTVWFKDNTWATRGEYDGSEWWEIHSLPDIPKELLP